MILLVTFVDVSNDLIFPTSPGNLCFNSHVNYTLCKRLSWLTNDYLLRLLGVKDISRAGKSHGNW